MADDELTAEELSREAREVEQLHVSLVRRIDELRAGIAYRRAHRDRVLADATLVELDADADRIAERVGELVRMDEADEDGIAALTERAEWAAELADELRARARVARGE
jgi:hypothetical protein